MIGERIGHLRVIESIGVGGMGAVWHAVDELLDRHVALKVIRPELMSRPGLAERFRSEAIVLARLQHPCIAALYGLEKRGEEFVMVMEYVDGQTLDSRLATQSVLPWPEATRITRAVLDALDHAHESGVIHRDIKPANVMITRAGRVKVMDFGIARLVGAQRQTRTGAAVGTPSYMSPEQLLGQEVDGRADVYAVGTLLYELCTGHLPFEVEGDYLRMIAQLQQIPALASTHVPDLPPGLDRIIARALQKEPEDRFSTSGDFRDALEELEREHGVLRPYGTPAAGSMPVPGAQNTRGTGTPGALPAVADDAAPARRVNPAALLTPVESASSVTPVPFSIDPSSATPIDLTVPSELVGAASAPEPVAAQRAAASEPPAISATGVTAAPGDVSTVADRSTKKAPAMQRAVLAGGAIAAVAFAGVMLNRNVSSGESAGRTAGDSVVMPAAPAAAPAAPALPAPALVADDSAARKQLLADSMKKVRDDSIKLARAARDSARKARADSLAKLDTAAKANPFDLGGASGAPSRAEAEANRRAAEQAAGRAARECVTALNTHEIPRLETLFGTERRRNIFRVARDGKLEVQGPLNTTVETDLDRATARFAAVLTYQNSKGEAQSNRATFRALVERRGTTWATAKCLIDDDGGTRY